MIAASKSSSSRATLNSTSSMDSTGKIAIDSEPMAKKGVKDSMGGNYGRTLRQILKVNELQNESAERIAEIWNTYHAEKMVISASITHKIYNIIHTRGKRFPMFILPLPRLNGFEFYLCQFAAHQVYYTSLLEYQTKQQDSVPSFVTSHFTEFSDKDLVLMVGELTDPAGEQLKLSDAQNLVYQTQLFYATGSQQQMELVEQFANNPESFDHNRLVDAVVTV